MASPPKLRTGIVLLIIILAGFLVVFSGSHLLPIFLVSSSCGGAVSQNPGSVGKHSVALIDQLGMQYPNPAFAQNVSETAKNAGYGFQYYPPETANVSFFVNLPTQDYSMVILRTHGTGLRATDPPAIVTSEHYSESQHTVDQLTDRVASVDVNGTLYFALAPSFVTDVMCGRFPHTIVLVMTCEGAEFTLLARAFLEKGAGAYVGWDRVVSVSHTDLVFRSLVKLLLGGKTVDQSVQNVMTNLGPDPLYGSRLVNYSGGSFSSKGSAWWNQYWYIISLGIISLLAGLAKIRYTSAGPRNRLTSNKAIFTHNSTTRPS